MRLPGRRADVRDRTTTVAMHMLRALLLRRLTLSAARWRLARRARPSPPRGRRRPPLACSSRSTCRRRARASPRSGADRRLAPVARRAARHARLPRRTGRTRRRRDRAVVEPSRARRAAARARRGAAAPAAARARPDRRARGPRRALAALQARVAGALAAAGVYTPESAPFRPHVTVARLRPRARPPRGDRPARAARVPRRAPSRSTARACTRRRPLRAARARAADGTLTATLSAAWSLPRPGGPVFPRCSPSPRSSPSRTPPQPRCTGARASTSAASSARTLDVPLDRAGVDPGTVPLRIARVGRTPGPTLMYLSGGPGGAGVSEMLERARGRPAARATASA